MSLINGPLASTIHYADLNTSSQYQWLLVSGGDTVRIVHNRNLSANSAGYPGEFSFGVLNGIPYLYYCYAADQWSRLPMEINF